MFPSPYNPFISHPFSSLFPGQQFPTGQIPAAGAPTVSPPPTPPPSFTPSLQQPQGISTYAVDPGAIRPCTNRFIYIRLHNGREFWAYLVYVGPRSASGWRWNGFYWVYFGIDLRRISSFYCY